MSGVATAIVGTAVVSGGISYLSSKSAAKSAENAAGVSADAQREALEYIKETEALPQELRRQALAKLGGVYGLTGPSTGIPAGPSTGIPAEQQYSSPISSTESTDIYNQLVSKRSELARVQREVDNAKKENFRLPREEQQLSNLQRDIQGLQDQLMMSQSKPGLPQQPTAQDPLTGLQDPTSGDTGGGGDTSGQQDLINQAENSPLYAAMIGGQELGEEAIMRNAGATGGLRSGNVQGNMYDYVTQLQNKALLASYNEQLSGLQGFAGLPSNSSEIAGYMSNIGATQAQGMTASGAMKAQGMQSGVNNAMSIAGLGIQAYQSGMFSDRLLKKNIVHIGKVNGHEFYKFDWNKSANELGLYGSTCGCMADEVYSKVPEAVTIKDDFLFVDYSIIGVL